jgi:transcription elongation factor Elf1
MKLHPMRECIQRAEALMAAGAEIYQQFNCARCGSKQTMETPNTFFTLGNCERCGAQTNIEANGCNYAVHLAIGGKQR